jgi:hypothetical protein
VSITQPDGLAAQPSKASRFTSAAPRPIGPNRGVKMRTGIRMRGISFYNLCGGAIYVLGQGTAASNENKGNPNNFTIENCFVHSCKYHGLHVKGADANAGTIINWSTHGGACVNGCAILDESWYGNVYIGGHFAGYGATGVSLAGRHYVLITNQLADGALTTPGTNPLVWYDIGVGPVDVNFPTWSSSGSYVLQLPIACFEPNNRSIFAGGYIEEINVPCILGPAAAELGGTLNWANSQAYWRNFNGVLSTGGGVQSIRGGIPALHPAYPVLGDNVYAKVGTYPGTEGSDGFTILHHYVQKENVEYKLGWFSPGLEITYGAGSDLIWRITSAVTTQDWLGTGSGLGNTPPHQIIFKKIAIQDDTGNTARRIWYGGAAPTSGGPYARGDKIFTTGATAGGKEGWVCVTAGSPGTWKTFGSIDP